MESLMDEQRSVGLKLGLLSFGLVWLGLPALQPAGKTVV